MTRTQKDIIRWSITSAVFAVAFGGLALLVHRGQLNGFDFMIYELARPGDVWGWDQIRASRMVDALRPAVVGGLAMIFTGIACARRRSLRPAVLLAVAGILTVGLTAVFKISIGRPDPHGWIAPDGGSFPSGHMIVVVVGLGLAALLMAPVQSAWWVWLVPTAAGSLMAVCLAITGTHWTTDILGGLLLAITILCAARACTPMVPGRNVLRKGGGTQRDESDLGDIRTSIHDLQNSDQPRQPYCAARIPRGEQYKWGTNEDRRLRPWLRRHRDGGGFGFARPYGVRCRCR